MAVNKTNKGNRYELEARKMLEGQGYLVERKNPSRWQGNDFWGMFDIIAIHPQAGIVRLVQVKTNMSDFYKARIAITQWALDNNMIAPNLDCEIWVREPRKAWRQDVIVMSSKPFDDAIQS